MTLNPFLDPKNDLAFKRVFGTERNKDILIRFLNDMLPLDNDDHPIKNVIFREAFQDARLEPYEQSLIDMFCVDTTGEIYIVKLVMARTSEAFTQRIDYYASQAYLDQYEAKRRLLWQVIIVAITEFDVSHERKNYRSIHRFLDAETHEPSLEGPIYTLLELPKFALTIDQLRSMTDRWAYFFKYAHETKREEVEMIAGRGVEMTWDKRDMIEKAYRRLERTSWTRRELEAYEQEVEQQRKALAAEEAEQRRREKEKERRKGPA